MRRQNVLRRPALAVMLFIMCIALAGMRSASHEFAGPSIPSAPQLWGAWSMISVPSLGHVQWPVVGQNQDGRLQVFVGVNNTTDCPDHCVYHVSQTVVNGDWGNWSPLGSTYDSVGSPAVTTNPAGQMQVFAQQLYVLFGNCGGYHTEAAQIRQIAPNGSWGAWDSLGNPTTSPPCPVDLWEPYLGVNQDGRIDVFAVGQGTDGNVWHQWQVAASDGWSGSWASLGRPAGLASVSPLLSTGRNQDGRLIVFVLGGGEIYQKWQNTTGDENDWSGWVSFGYPPGVNLSSGSEPVLGRNADGRLEFFTAGSDGAIWTKWQVAPNSYWSGWYSLGQPTGINLSRPVVGLRPNGAMDVFAQGDNYAVWHIYQNGPNGGWGTWETLYSPYSTNLTGQIAVGRNQDGRMIVFAVNTAGSLWARAEDRWHTYVPLVAR